MTATVVYLQNMWARLRDREEGQTMAEYALILGLIAVFVDHHGLLPRWRDQGALRADG